MMFSPARQRAFLLLMGIVLSIQLKAHVELNYPEGGETYHPGDIITTTWTETIKHNTQDWDLFYSVDGGDSWIILKEGLALEARSYQWLIPDVPTTTAKIKVIQDNEGGDYERASQNFTIATVTGILDPSKPAEIIVFPNPFTDIATLEFPFPINDKHTLTIYNTQGIVVRSIKPGSSGKIELRRGDLAVGYYFLQLREKRQIRATAKFLIQ
jgi:hypothetical protein